MAQDDQNVKPAVLRWVDCHPRTGWYIAVLVTLNLLLQLVELLL